LMNIDEPGDQGASHDHDFGGQRQSSPRRCHDQIRSQSGDQTRLARLPGSPSFPLWNYLELNKVCSSLRDAELDMESLESRWGLLRHAAWCCASSVSRRPYASGSMAEAPEHVVHYDSRHAHWRLGVCLLNILNVYNSTRNNDNSSTIRIM
jgi:hypothetical protein